MAVKTVYHEIGSRGTRSSAARKRRTVVRRTVMPRTSGFDNLFLKLAAAALRLEKARPSRR
jgi:hypothetical protein